MEGVGENGEKMVGSKEVRRMTGNGEGGGRVGKGGERDGKGEKMEVSELTEMMEGNEKESEDGRR